MKDTKKIIVIVVAAVLVMVTVLAGGWALLSGGGKGAPAMEDVYDRLVATVEESLTLNAVLFGEGVPVYESDSVLAEQSHMYYGATTDWEYVMTDYARFGSTVEIKDAMERVYSKAYCASLEEMLFTGVAFGGEAVSAKYTDTNRFSQSQKAIIREIGMRFYDYSSMTILPQSNSTCLKVSVRCYSEKTPDTWEDRTLTFVYENENWYLDSPTY